MKKTLSLLLAAVMLLCFGASLAEEIPDTEVNPMFDVKLVLPEGYQASEEDWVDPSYVYLELRSEDRSKPFIQLSISYEDLYSEVTFNRDTWDREIVQNCVSSLAYNPETQMPDEYTTRETGLGTVVMIINEADYTRFLTIWRGYQLTLFACDLTDGDATLPVGEASMDTVMQFLTDLDISEVIVEPAA